MWKFNLILFIFCFSVIISCNLDNDSQTKQSSYHTVIYGQVLNKTTSNPIDSAEVILSKSSTTFLGTFIILTVYTDNEGKFYIDNYCTDDETSICSFSLEIYKKSYQSITSFTDFEEDEENDITIYLTPFASYHTIIEGQVLDKTTGRPIENAAVELKKSGRYPGSVPSTILTIFTNDEGRFFIDNSCTEDLFYFCDFTLEITKNSYQPITSFADIEEGTENKVTIYLTPE